LSLLDVPQQRLYSPRDAPLTLITLVSRSTIVTPTVTDITNTADDLQ